MDGAVADVLAVLRLTMPRVGMGYCRTYLPGALLLTGGFLRG
jgi:hypothetical protein